jgi:DNA-binding response OmpR family regulator
MFNKPLLEDEGFAVKTVMTLREAREAVAIEMPRLIILDIHLPDGNGLDFLRELRKTSNVPVIALTNNKEEQDIVAGLASGCDDYIPKPYTFAVLLARMEALLRRVERVTNKLTIGPLSVDILAQRVYLNGTDLNLQPKECAVLLMLMQNENKPVSAQQLYETAWKLPMNENAGAVQYTVSNLRKKLEDSGYYIANIRKTGYVFECE